MKQQYIDKIKETCIKANPSILDLKSGCEVIRGSDFGGSPENVFIGNPYECKEVLGKSIIQVQNPWNIDDTDDLIEVLGRPIQLADVLLALKNKGVEYGSTNFSVYCTVLLQMDKPLWNLTKPLEDQSEETLKFISELLK